MGLFDNIKKSLKLHQMDDPFFGVIIFQRSKVWEGKKLFEPLSREIHFTIVADEDGPQQAHQEFFYQLGLRYHQLREHLEQSLVQELSKKMNKPFTGNARTEFRLDSFLIPDPRVIPHQWELVFFSESTDRFFYVFMDGWQLKGIKVAE